MKPSTLSIDDYHKAVEIFHSESDRGAAVLAGSFLESYIAAFLRSHMIDDPEVDKLFDGFGPFADYYKRVEGAFAFGLINDREKRDLRYIAKIRNHFAHHPLEAAFDKSPVFEWCRELSTKEVYPLAGQEANPKTDNRFRYIIAVSLLVANWHNKMLAKSGERNA